jgi:hypothetical protein
MTKKCWAVGSEDPEAALEQERGAVRENMSRSRDNATDNVASETTDPVDKVFAAFLRLDGDQRARLKARRSPLEYS